MDGTNIDPFFYRKVVKSFKLEPFSITVLLLGRIFFRYLLQIVLTLIAAMAVDDKKRFPQIEFGACMPFCLDAPESFLIIFKHFLPFKILMIKCKS
jgi:hypothetical protein